MRNRNRFVQGEPLDAAFGVVFSNKEHLETGPFFFRDDEAGVLRIARGGVARQLEHGSMAGPFVGFQGKAPVAQLRWHEHQGKRAISVVQGFPKQAGHVSLAA